MGGWVGGWVYVVSLWMRAVSINPSNADFFSVLVLVRSDH